MNSQERTCKNCIQRKPNKNINEPHRCLVEIGAQGRIDQQNALDDDFAKVNFFKALGGVFYWRRSDHDHDSFYALYCPFYLTQEMVRSAEDLTSDEKATA